VSALLDDQRNEYLFLEDSDHCPMYDAEVVPKLVENMERFFLSKL